MKSTESMNVEGESQVEVGSEENQDGEEEKQREEEEGKGAGSSMDGLGHRVATGEDEPDADEDYIDGEAEEGRTARGMPSPIVVSKQEKEQHELTHLPFRSWCSHCVRGRARNMMHKRDQSKDERSNVPRVSMDYFYLTSKKNKEMKEEEEENAKPMLVMKDEQTGDRYARMVQHKGTREGDDGGWIVADVLAELRAWGHQGGEGGHIILKSDGEAAIMSLIDEVAKRLGGKVVIEKPQRRVPEQWSSGGDWEVGAGHGKSDERCNGIKNPRQDTSGGRCHAVAY